MIELPVEITAETVCVLEVSLDSPPSIMWINGAGLDPEKREGVAILLRHIADCIEDGRSIRVDIDDALKHLLEDE